jgi:glycosyltransferase involved in cell wall biosynthesis
MPELSVIVPVWNGEKTLSFCLEALAGQTVAEDKYEVIIIDDGSTDRTAKIADQFSVVYHRQENQGPAAARNKGVSLAKGGLVFFTDADCAPDPDWLKEMTAPFSDPEVAAAKGTYRTEQKGIVARFSQLEFEERFAMLAKQSSIDMVDTYSAGFRKEIFQALGGFDTRFPEANNEDTEFSYRMAEQGHCMVFAPRAVVRHLSHPDSILRYFRLKFSRGFWRMMVYRMFPGKMIKDSYTPQSLKLQIIGLFCVGASMLSLPFLPQVGATALLCSMLFFCAQSIPFTFAAFKKDQAAAWLSLPLLILRAAAIGSGALWGLILMRTGQDIFSKKNPCPKMYPDESFYQEK